MSLAGPPIEGGFTHTHTLAPALIGGYRVVLHHENGPRKILEHKICSNELHCKKDNFCAVISTQCFIHITFHSLKFQTGKSKGHHRTGHQGPERR
jgi:hypothetical protein